jgi:RHS repeat-associated protein
VVQEEAFNPFRYVGQYGVMHEGNGLYYMRARYYQPELRRFLGEDPIWNKNLYGYVENNPIITIDPSGLRGVIRREITHVQPKGVAKRENSIASRIASLWNAGKNTIKTTFSTAKTSVKTYRKYVGPFELTAKVATDAQEKDVVGVAQKMLFSNPYSIITTGATIVPACVGFGDEMKTVANTAPGINFATDEKAGGIRAVTVTRKDCRVYDTDPSNPLRILCLEQQKDAQWPWW